jgi:quercetin dioxygenase-like cupin family protein
VAFQPTEGMTTSRIRYEAGARTNWHTHTAPQMLWVEDGRGLWQERGDSVKEMLKDVPVVTKANVTHWHGAPANSHSVQLTVYGGTITWGAPVTDAEYQGKK